MAASAAHIPVNHDVPGVLVGLGVAMTCTLGGRDLLKIAPDG
ncbi:hypothetical protein ACQPX6_22365 [Actinomycetospora sp. CA-101289]